MGWSFGIEDDFRVGVCKYEIGVFEKGKQNPQKIFRTDVENAITIIETEARKYIAHMQLGNPDVSYQLKKLEWVDM